VQRSFVPELVDGEIEFDEDGRVFLVEQFPNRDGSTHERKIFLLQISKKGEVLMDGNVVDRIQAISDALRIGNNPRWQASVQ